MKQTKVYKVELLIVDHDDIGEEAVKIHLEETKYPNWCMHPRVMNVWTRRISWTDEHPLNILTTMKAAFEKLFKRPV